MRRWVHFQNSSSHTLKRTAFVRRKLYLNKSDFKKNSQDFPGGAVVKNPPANAGDTG